MKERKGITFDVILNWKKLDFTTVYLLIYFKTVVNFDPKICHSRFKIPSKRNQVKRGFRGTSGSHYNIITSVLLSLKFRKLQANHALISIRHFNKGSKQLGSLAFRGM